MQKKHSSLLNKVHRNSTRKMTRTVQLQAWRVHCPINAQIGLLIANHVREFCYSFDYYYNHIYDKILDHDWFSTRLFAT